MILSKDIKLLPGSKVEVVIRVSKNVIQEKYNLLLKDYSSRLKIQGFRIGKVPISIIENKYSEGLRATVLEEVVNDTLKEFFKEEPKRPLSYTSPIIKEKNLRLNLDEDFEFTFVYETYPEFEIPNVNDIDIKVEVPEVFINDSDIDNEIKYLQMENSIIIEDEEGVVKKDSIVRVDFVELDDLLNEIVSTRRQDFVFTVGESETYYDFDRDLIGMRINEEIVIEKSYIMDYKFEELAGSSRKLKIKIKSIKKRDLPLIDDEFAKDISDKYNTLDDLKNFIRSNILNLIEEKKETLKLNKFFSTISEKLEIDIPHSMIEAEIEIAFKDTKKQNKMSFEEFKGMFYSSGYAGNDNLKDEILSNLKSKLIIQKMVDLDPIEVTANDLEDEMARQSENSGVSYEEIKKFYEGQNLISYLKDDIKRKRAKKRILANLKEVKGKQISFKDFVDYKVCE
ncbi:trigger factor [Borreliella japonica]|uniref:Trigger factor n=1 Tax=Borreliella japonica TaxID=34095 RepID=A0A1G4P586_BORJA|nr:trigger factor [Borreliella japonica]WKC89197.1 trigger factor [Borreliella japonica]SCW27452.1 trigger factor [Borreliella japonica]